MARVERVHCNNNRHYSGTPGHSECNRNVYNWIPRLTAHLHEHVRHSDHCTFTCTHQVHVNHNMSQVPITANILNEVMFLRHHLPDSRVPLRAALSDNVPPTWRWLQFLILVALRGGVLAAVITTGPDRAHDRRGGPCHNWVGWATHRGCTEASFKQSSGAMGRVPHLCFGESLKDLDCIAQGFELAVPRNTPRAYILCYAM